MTKNQFLKKFGLKAFPIWRYKPYLDIVAHYKGRLSYFRLYCLIMTAVTVFRRWGMEDILSYVSGVKDSEVSKIRTKSEHIGLRATVTTIDESHATTEVSE